MVVDTKLYDVLGVPPDADSETMRKAYLKKARKLHPDKNPEGAEEFKTLKAAYDVLSSPEKRKAYDQYGKDAPEMSDMDGMDPHDLFSQLFGGGMFGGGGRGRPSGPQKGKDLNHTLKVTLEELYRGKTTKIALQKHVLCAKCDGRGGKAGAVKRCDVCNGQGVRVHFRQMGPMVQQVQQVCGDCHGKGEIINPKDRCRTCDGKKITSERKVLDVSIDKGMKDGQTIVFSGEADQAPGIVPGDVIISIQQQPHSRFTRKGDDLLINVDIDLFTALGGGSISIEHLDDRIVVANIPRGIVIKPGDLKTIRGQGMPSYRFHEPGDMLISVQVIFPDSLNADAIKMLEAVLPPPAPAATYGPDVFVEHVNLEEATDRQAKTAGRDANDRMEDEDAEDGRQRVQCANQ